MRKAKWRRDKVEHRQRGKVKCLCMSHLHMKLGQCQRQAFTSHMFAWNELCACAVCVCVCEYTNVTSSCGVQKASQWIYETLIYTISPLHTSLEPPLNAFRRQKQNENIQNDMHSTWYVRTQISFLFWIAKCGEQWRWYVFNVNSVHNSLILFRCIASPIQFDIYSISKRQRSILRLTDGIDKIVKRRRKNIHVMKVERTSVCQSDNFSRKKKRNKRAEPNGLVQFLTISTLEMHFFGAEEEEDGENVRSSRISSWNAFRMQWIRVRRSP